MALDERVKSEVDQFLSTMKETDEITTSGDQINNLHLNLFGGKGVLAIMESGEKEHKQTGRREGG